MNKLTSKTMIATTIMLVLQGSAMTVFAQIESGGMPVDGKANIRPGEKQALNPHPIPPGRISNGTHNSSTPQIDPGPNQRRAVSKRQGGKQSLNPQPIPPGKKQALNPHPIPPGRILSGSNTSSTPQIDPGPIQLRR